MKRIAILVSVGILAFGLAMLAQQRNGGAEQELLKLEQQWGDALIKPDLTFLDRILAEDYLFTSPLGEVLTKTQMLAELKSGEDIVSSVVNHEMKVRVYGDAAVVNGHSTYKEKVKGVDISGEYRWSDTWIKKDGRWQCVADHASRVAGKAKAPEANVEADVAAIKALNDELVKLYNAEDFDRLMSVFYAENPIQMSPNVPVRRGKEAILLAYQDDSRSNIEHIDSSVVEDVRISGKLAVAWGIDTGTTTPRKGGEPVPYNLKWLAVFEHQPDGAWKCLYEMWNDNPLPGSTEKRPQD